MRWGRIALASGLAAVAATAWAQDLGSRPTREFVQGAAQSDAFEILEAQVVLTQSNNPQVRDFATMMISAHQATRQALVEAAMRDGLKPPAPGPGGDQAMLLSGLQSMSGPGFDKAYATHQVIAHRSALTVEQKYAATGDSPAVRKAADDAVPVIASHLSMAEQLAAKLGAR